VSGFDDGWAQFEAEAGPLLADELAQQSPVVTGQLRDSMTSEDQSGVLTVGSRDDRGPIARYVTRGTHGPYDIYPVYARALHFIGSDGGDVFTQHVVHPGIAANPFHTVAWETRRDEVINLFRERVGHAVTLSVLNPWKNRVI
jgi:hypothetical protein